MRVPPPRDIETRLLIVAQMLEKAVAEVQHVMTDIRGERVGLPSDEPSDEPRRPDDQR